MKEKLTNKYAFNLAEKKKVKVLKGGELDFDNMNKGFYDELVYKDDKIRKLRTSLNHTKSWTIRESVYANIDVPQVWKNKLNYSGDVMKIISKDNSFFTYLTKVNTGQKENKRQDNLNKPDRPVETASLSQRGSLEVKDQSSIQSPNRNPLFDDRSQSLARPYFSPNEEGEEFLHRSKSRHTTIHKKFYNTKGFKELRTFSDKEKREILDNYKEMYPLFKKRNFSEITGEFDKHLGKTNSFQNLPNITSHKKTSYPAVNSAYGFGNTQKSQMFKSSIYNLLVPTKNSLSNFDEDLSDKMQHDDQNHTNSLFKKRSKSTLASIQKKSSKTEYGPFLNFNYAEYNKKIEIKNPEVKKVLEDIDYFGPYFSHCPSCRNKNLEFYQTMEPHNCLDMLNFIKKTRKKNILSKEVNGKNLVKNN